MDKEEKANRGASRREFLGGIAAAAAVGGCRSLFGAEPFYGPTIRDRLWMWGHHAQMCHKSGFKDGRKWEGPTVEQAEGCKLMGIPNDCFIRWGNMPAHPWGDYVEQFRQVKRFPFGIGIYDYGRGKTVIARKIKKDEVEKGRFKLYKLGRCALPSASCSTWMGRSWRMSESLGAAYRPGMGPDDLFDVYISLKFTGDDCSKVYYDRTVLVGPNVPGCP